MSTAPLRLVAIGCGRVFERYHLPAIRATAAVQLVGVCDIDAARRAWASAALATKGEEGRPCVACLDELPPSVTVDAALVATPPATHSAIAAALLEVGLHVLVEKPMALTLAEARRMAAAQREARRVLRMGFNRRYRADYDRLRRFARGIREVAFTFLADERRWGGAPASPAFVLHDAGSHAVDLVSHIGAAPAVAVRARADQNGRAVRVEAKLGNGVRAECTVGNSDRYEEHLSVTVAAPASSGATRRVRVTTATRFGNLALAWCKLTGRPTPAGASFQSQLSAFAAACRGEPDAIGADAADGLRSVAVIEACLSSLDRAGAWCDVSPSG